MGDLERDTALVSIGNGRFQAQLSREWEIWGPMGGYVAAVAIRAAGARSPFPRPASFSCHYLGVAGFDDPVQVEVETQRAARTACSQRVTIKQADRPILVADVWSVGNVDGLEHHELVAPDVPGPDGLMPMEELMPAESQYPFWANVEERPLSFEPEWPPPGPLPPRWQCWTRLRPTATFADPWVDAARSVILIDVQGWPAAHHHHAWREPAFIAPSLDLYVAFHEPAPTDPWLLADGSSPVAGDGLVGWHGRLWSTDSRLVASGGGQLLCRRVPTAG